MAVTYEIVDDAVTLTYTLVPAISATVTLTVTKPDASTTSPSVVEAPIGTYKATFALDLAGTWLYKFKATGAATDAEDGFFFVEPSVAANLYVTVDQMKARFGISDPVNDYQLRHVIKSASRAIDDETGRRFYADAAATARQYRTADYGAILSQNDGELLFVDDIASLTGLVVETGDGTTWTAVTDFSAEPLNALVQAEPVTRLRRKLGFWSISLQSQVRVTARWGWPQIPPPIREATELLVSRLFKRKDAPFGVAGFGEFGDLRITMSDPDVARLINRYQLPGFS